MTGVSGSATSRLEGVTPTLAYYDGTYTSSTNFNGLTSSSVAPTTTGNYTVLATFLGSGDYNTASDVANFTIAPATPIVTVTDAGGTYDGTAFPATATVTGASGLPASSLEGIAPTLAYYSGTYTSAAQLNGLTGSSARRARRQLHRPGHLPRQRQLFRRHGPGQLHRRLDRAADHLGPAGGHHLRHVADGRPARCLDHRARDVHLFPGPGLDPQCRRPPDPVDHLHAQGSVHLRLGRRDHHDQRRQGHADPQRLRSRRRLRRQCVPGLDRHHRLRVPERARDQPPGHDADPDLLHRRGSSLGPAPPTASGSYTVVAVFPGTIDYTTAQSEPVPFTIAQGTTTIALSSSSRSAAYGQSVTFVATVSPTASGTPTGTIMFSDGGAVLGTVALDGSVKATLTTSALALGSNAVTATYSGDVDFLGTQSGSTSESVSKAATQVALVPEGVFNTKKKLVSVGLKAEVEPVSPGGGVPTGNVIFELVKKTRKKTKVTTLGTMQLRGGDATLPVKSKQVLNKAVTIVYSGDADFLPVTNTPLTLKKSQLTSLARSVIAAARKN